MSYEHQKSGVIFHFPIVPRHFARKALDSFLSSALMLVAATDLAWGDFSSWLGDNASGKIQLNQRFKEARGNQGSSPFGGPDTGNLANQVDQIEEIRRLALQGDADAQVNLGGFYRSVKNESEATRWFHRAAEQGHRKAQLFLGYRYLYGIGATKSPGLGESWLRRAAEQGESEAIEVLLRQSRDEAAGAASRVISEFADKDRATGKRGEPR